MRILILCLSIIASCSTSIAATITALSTSSADVQSAINAAAASGDTVVVPAGSSTWTTKVSVSGKSLTIQGNGIGSTIITDGTTSSAFGIDCGANKFIRLTGFEFRSSGNHTSSGILDIFGNQAVTGFRVDHCRILITSAVTRGIVPNSVYGVIDHCDLLSTASSGSVQIVSVWGSIDGSDGGYTPWTRPLTLGTTNAVYVEDCNVSEGNQSESAFDSYGGARFVIRYNFITNTEFAGCHGTDSGDRRSAHSFEVYNNVYVNNSGNKVRAATIRGGTGVFFNNTYGGSTTWDGVTLMYYRACPPLDQSGWGTCNGTLWKINSASLSAQGSRQCNAGGSIGFSTTDNETLGTFGPSFNNYFDGQSANGYPGRDQPGFTTGQVSSPVYVWTNGTLGAAGTYDGGNPPTGGIEAWIKAGRDYTNAMPKDGYAPLIHPHPLVSGITDPFISQEPANSIVAVGANATFTATASGSGTLHYQWKKSGSNVGTDSSSYTLSSVQTSDNGANILVTVTSSGGSLDSSVALVGAIGSSDPAITAQPQNQSVQVGQNATFTVTTTGSTTRHFAWTFNGGSVGTDSSSYTRNSCQLTDNAGSVQVAVSDVAGSLNSSVAILTVTSAGQSTNFVAKTGNDSNGGTLASPWLTIAHALAAVSAGDTIYVLAGTYSEGDQVITRPSGSSGSLTILSAYTNAQVKLIGSGNTGRVAMDALSFFVFDGITVSNLNQGVYIRNGSHDIIVRNCDVGNCGQELIRVVDTGYNITCSNNFVHDGGALGGSNGEGFYIGNDAAHPDTTHDVLISSNIITRTLSEGVELKEGSHNCIVQYNTVSTNNTGATPASSIEVDDTVNYASNPNHIVRYNVVHDSGANSQGIRAGTGVHVYGNVVWGISSGKFAVLADNTQSDSYTRRISQNTMDVVSGRSVSLAGTTAVTNNIGPSSADNAVNSSAYYVDAANHDYHLVSSGAVRGAGTNLNGSVTVDFDGATYLTPPSMGAFEFIQKVSSISSGVGAGTKLFIGSGTKAFFGQ